MTVEEMHKARHEAEKAIAEALNRFMEATKLRVNEVQVGWMDSASLRDSHARRYVTSVNLDVRL